MTTAPFVELGFNPTDLRPRDLPRAGAFLGSPAEALEAALAVARAAMVDRMKAEVRGIANPTYSQVLRVADLAWQGLFWKYRKVSAPVMADAYIRAYRKANAGDVPMSVIYDLADRHAEKVGDYFHASSRDALAEGFNSMVNRRVPAKAAADRVLDAYGLTPRQMRGYTSAKQFELPITDVTPRALKAKSRAYIDKSFTGRIKKLSQQEEHNIDQQAQQFAWMWLQDKGRLSEKAQKMWITAKDERVCEVCGPLHGQKVLVNEQFTTGQGEFWTPGLHPNCRCVVRLLENRFTVEKRFDPHQPRGKDGKWSGGQSKSRQLSTKVNRLQSPSAKVLENTVIHRGSQVLSYVKEPRFITTPLKHRDREMARVAHGAAAWSRRSANVTRTRDMHDPDNEYYAKKMKLTRTEKSLKSLIRAVESAPSNAPELYRGLSVSPSYMTELQVGSTMDLPLSSFSQDRKFSEMFAAKWGPMIARRRARKAGAEHHPLDAMPVVFVLEPKAQALNIAPLVAERQAEWIAKGEFLITKVGEDNGVAVVHLKQTRGKVSKADTWDPEEHPRGGDPENKGRFSRIGVKERTRDTRPIIETTPEPEVEPEIEPEPAPRPPIGASQERMIGSSVRPPPARPAGPRAPIGTPTREPLGSTVSRPEIGSSVTRAPIGGTLGEPVRTPLGSTVAPAPIGGVSEPLTAQKGRPDLAPVATTLLLHPDGRPYYAVVSEAEGVADTDFSLYHRAFVDNLNSAKAEVALRRQHRIAHLLEQKTAHSTRPVKVSGRDPYSNEIWYGQISPEDFQMALTAFAEEAVPDIEFTEMPTYSEYLSTPRRDASGKQMAGDGVISFADIVVQQGIRPEDFVFQILESTRAHDDDELTRRHPNGRYFLSGSYVQSYDLPPSTVPDSHGKETKVIPIEPYE